MKILSVDTDRFTVQMSGAECSTVARTLAAACGDTDGRPAAAAERTREAVLFAAFSAMHQLARACEQSQHSEM